MNIKNDETDPFGEPLINEKIGLEGGSESRSVSRTVQKKLNN